MNKKAGFTLAEILISLGVVAVVSALMMAAINSLKPDSTKSKYLNTYNALSKAIKGAADNTHLYPMCSSTDSKCYPKHPLMVTDRKAISTKDGTMFGGNNNKICEVLADAFHINNNRCATNAVYARNIDPSFTTPEGVCFWVHTDRSLDGNRGNYLTTIIIDVDGQNKGQNDLWGNGVTNPDRFKFLVDATGKIVIADPVGRAYVTTRKNLKRSTLELDDLGILNSLTSSSFNAKELDVIEGDGEGDEGDQSGGGTS